MYSFAPSDNPKMVEKNYKEIFKEPCIPTINNDYDWQEFKGTGVKLEDHPLNGTIPMRECPNCDSKDVKVIYAKWCVSVHSGDTYWDYEIFCEACKKFSLRSYAEND